MCKEEIHREVNGDTGKGLPALPFLISIPHGGTEMPEELSGRVLLTPQDLFDDSDSFTREIYDLGDSVIKVVQTDIARAFVDVNRPPEERPPQFPDGVIKANTCLLKPIYKDGKHPSPELIATLISNYYKPYHSELREWCGDSRIVIGLDCHSMLPRAPQIAPDKGMNRPLINLGNLDGISCPNHIVSYLAESFRSEFGLGADDISINRPFTGGYITKTCANNPIPWIQIEMNRKLYLDARWFSRKELHVVPDHLIDLNRKFKSILKQFHDKLVLIK